MQQRQHFVPRSLNRHGAWTDVDKLRQDPRCHTLVLRSVGVRTGSLPYAIERRVPRTAELVLVLPERHTQVRDGQQESRSTQCWCCTRYDPRRNHRLRNEPRNAVRRLLAGHDR